MNGLKAGWNTRMNWYKGSISNRKTEPSRSCVHSRSPLAHCGMESSMSIRFLSSPDPLRPLLSMK